MCRVKGRFCEEESLGVWGFGEIVRIRWSIFVEGGLEWIIRGRLFS